MSDPILKEAQRRVEQKKGFYQHLTVFLSCGIFFFLLNMITDRVELWYFFPLLPWGVALFIHYVSTFGLPWTGALSPEWEAKQIKKEIAQIQQQLSVGKEEQKE